MTESEFRAQAIANGFADFQTKHYASDLDGPLHTHNFAVTLLVTEGEFALQFEDRKDVFQTGECCNLAANVMHAERAGSQGAVVFLAKKE
ncbi:MAG: cupin domain-containing protein [Burkholderiales bacterium]|nr:cupin domain-containing protein [Burkholderiales bacterium]